MAFKYEMKVNGITRRVVEKCLTSLLFIEIVRDMMSVDKMGKNKEIKKVTFEVTRT